MKTTPRQERKKKRRGRPSRSALEKSRIVKNSDNTETIVIGSSPESCGDKRVIPSLVSREKTSKCVDATPNSIDTAIENVVAYSRLREEHRHMFSMKELRVTLERAEDIPGLLNARNKSALSKPQHKRKRNAATLKAGSTRRKRAIAKPEVKLSIEAISISSSSIPSDWSLYRTTPKKSRESSRNKRRESREAKEAEERRCETKIVGAEKKETARALSFGERSATAPKIKEEPVSDRTASSGSLSTRESAKRKRPDDEFKIHPFFAELNESSKNQRSRKSPKRARKDNTEMKDKICKQLENQTFINEKLGLTKLPVVHRADDAKASRNDAAQFPKLPGTVENSWGPKRIESAKNLIGIATEKESLDSGRENGASGKLTDTVKNSPSPKRIQSAKNLIGIAAEKESLESGRENGASGKLTDTVKNSPSPKRIQSAKNLIGIATEKESLESGRENSASDKENTATLEIVAEKAAVNEVEDRCDDLSSIVNGDGRIKEFKDLPDLLYSDVGMKIMNDFTTNSNEVRLFSAPDIASDHALDKEPCTLDSISQAIDQDVAGGNRLSPLPSDLLPFSSIFDNEENRVEDTNTTKRPVANGSSKNNESFHELTIDELEKNLDKPTENLENDAMPKHLPSIMNDEILPQGRTIDLQMIRDNRRRKKINQAIPAPVSCVGNKLSTDIRETSATHDKRIAVSEMELEALLLNEHSANNNSSASIEDGYVCEDVLNNNQRTTITNKNEMNSEKQENGVTMYTAPAETEDGTLNDHLYDMERFLQAVDSNVLENGSANVETQSEIVNVNERDIVQELNVFTNGNFTNLGGADCSKNAENGEAESIGALTLGNLNMFNDCLANDKISMIRRETIDTEVSSLRTEASATESAKMRKRKWLINGEAPQSAQTPRGRIRLNRRKLSNGSDDSRDKSNDRVLETEESLAKLSSNDDKKNDIGNPVIAETVSVINEISQRLISPIMRMKECNGGAGSIDSGVVGASLCNLVTSTPTKNNVALAIDEDENDSLDSSSSDSSSSSSSSSSDEESSDESEDQRVTSEIRINGENDEEMAKKGKESRKLDFGNEVEAQTARISAEDEIVPSFGADAEKLDIEIETAGSFIENGNCPVDPEDDESDCISLDTESLCMSRCASPEREPPRRPAPVLSPKKPPKPGNVKSRLGPRVAVQTQPDASTVTTPNSNVNVQNSRIATKNIIKITTVDENVRNIQHASNKIVNVEASANNCVNVNLEPCRTAAVQVQAPLAASNALQGQPIVAPPVVLVPVLKSEKEVEALFRGHCFAWLKTGTCRNPDQCWFYHWLQDPIQYHLSNVANHQGIVQYAVRFQYRHFVGLIQKCLMAEMPPHQLFGFGFYLAATRFLDRYLFLNIIAALGEIGLTHAEIVKKFGDEMLTHDVTSSMVIMDELCKILKPGTRWETLKEMIMQFPVTIIPLTVVTEVVNECVMIHSDKSHLDDVWENLVSKLSGETVGAHGDLLAKFYDLRKATLVDESTNPTVVTMRERGLSCGIASPDSPREPEREQDFPFAAELDNHASVSPPTSFVQSQNLENNANALTSSVNEKQAASTSGTSSYSLQPIGQLPPRTSVRSDSIWKFHSDLRVVREALEHRDYDMVIEQLQLNQRNPNRLPYMAGYYSILCKEITSSTHHMNEIIRRAVHSGASDELHRYIYDLGVHVLTALADTGAWILAYGLLKTFKVYGQYNTCAYSLLSAEICIANHRPLKALAILKQSGLVFSNQRRWNQMWCPDDEPLRVSVMELLLISLCDGHAEYALSLLDFILKEQCSNYKPINISRHVDRIARTLLSENRTHAVVDLGRLIMENNLFVEATIFRAVINSVFHSDQFLAKQLHRYATLLGAYTMPKISGITHMIINIDWTEEEIYLMVSSMIYELYVNIGHAIDRLRPRQLAVYLILEAMPTERQLSKDTSEPPLNNAEINRRRDLVKKVCDRFDPKIKVIQKAQGKFCKIKSESLVNYLKAGHFK